MTFQLNRATALFLSVILWPVLFIIGCLILVPCSAMIGWLIAYEMLIGRTDFLAISEESKKFINPEL